MLSTSFESLRYSRAGNFTHLKLLPTLFKKSVRTTAWEFFLDCTLVLNSFTVEKGKNLVYDVIEIEFCILL